MSTIAEVGEAQELLTPSTLNVVSPNVSRCKYCWYDTDYGQLSIELFDLDILLLP
ncbi:MAG: hypothetical protein HKO48_02835 [Nitrosopumilus sp.]|nr:hypothetical protein [Nitrosopumilus sp.]